MGRKFTGNEMRMLILLGLAIVGVIYYYAFWGPISDKVEDAKKRVEESKVNYNTLVSRANALQELEEKYETLSKVESKEDLFYKSGTIQEVYLRTINRKFEGTDMFFDSASFSVSEVDVPQVSAEEMAAQRDIVSGTTQEERDAQNAANKSIMEEANMNQNVPTSGNPENAESSGAKLLKTEAAIKFIVPLDKFEQFYSLIGDMDKTRYKVVDENGQVVPVTEEDEELRDYFQSVTSINISFVPIIPESIANSLNREVVLKPSDYEFDVQVVITVDFIELIIPDMPGATPIAPSESSQTETETPASEAPDTEASPAPSE